MKRAHIIAGVTALTLITTSGAALAFGGDKGRHDGPRGPRIDFEQVDTNKDGNLSKDELAAHAKMRFDATDTDGNGAISKTEMQAEMETKMKERMAKRADKMMGKMLKRHDANNDGELSFDEMRNGDRADKMFDRMDADEDGMISSEEFAQMGKRMGPKGGHGEGHKHGQKKRMSE